MIAAEVAPGSASSVIADSAQITVVPPSTTSSTPLT